jgi:hypothetical protein
MMRANREAYTVKYDSGNHCEVLFKLYGSVWPKVSERERQDAQTCHGAQRAATMNGILDLISLSRIFKTLLLKFKKCHLMKLMPLVRFSVSQLIFITLAPIHTGPSLLHCQYSACHSPRLAEYSQRH